MVCRVVYTAPRRCQQSGGPFKRQLVDVPVSGFGEQMFDWGGRLNGLVGGPFKRHDPAARNPVGGDFSVGSVSSVGNAQSESVRWSVNGTPKRYVVDGQ